MDQIPDQDVAGKRLAQLSNNPGCSRACRNVDLQDLSTSMSNDEPGTEKSEARRRHNGEVHRTDRVFVIASERNPPLSRVSVGRSPRKVPRDRGQADADTKLL